MNSKRIQSMPEESHCQAVNCQTQCLPACSPSEQCVLTTMSECGQCPPAKCVPFSSLNLAASDVQRMAEPSKPNTGLIAGLTTGLVVGAVIIVSVAGFVFLKRRRRVRERSKPQHQPSSLDPTAPVVVTPNESLQAVSASTDVVPMTTVSSQWPQVPAPVLLNSPLSPAFGPSSPLHIPRLEALAPSDPHTVTTVLPSPPTSATIRRSLNMSTSTHAFQNINNQLLNRSSSVRVTKYDHAIGASQKYETTDNLFEDLENENKVVIRRAVSVKKTGSEGLSRSASVRSVPAGSALSSDSAQGSTVQLLYAKPTRVQLNTISKEGGVVRMASVRSVSSHRSRLTEEPAQQEEQLAVLSDEHLRVQSWASQWSTSQSRHSSMADGEITVFWDASHHEEHALP